MFQARIKEKLQYEDLDETENSRSINLRLSRMERYLHGPTTVISARYTSSEDVIEATHAVSSEINHWNPDLSNVRTTVLILSFRTDRSGQTIRLLQEHGAV